MDKTKLSLVKKSFLYKKPVIVFDAKDRENEADFIIPIDVITPEVINFMITVGRGLLCCAITQKRQRELDLDLMASKNNSPFYTNFTVSVDLNSPDITTGITVQERFLTLKALADKEKTGGDFNKPGHIFPIVAMDGLLKSRKGHTEASIHLCNIFGYTSCACLIEILDDDGNRADLEFCKKIASKENLEILDIQDLV
jgi:3,4-dihydroxy 2-butanone 4-phosphate synthase/GTP cyclohydrolase II